MVKHPFSLCISSGLLLAFSFPPLQFGFLAYVGLVPLFILIDDDQNLISSIRYGFITGFVFNLGTLYWIAWDTVPGIPVIVASTFAVAIILSLFFITFTLCLSFVRGRIGQVAFIASPFLWAAIEYLRSHGVLAFPWTSLAYSQSYYLSFIQYISFTSVYGVSFWIISINVLFYFWIKKSLKLKKSYCILIVLAIFFLLPYVYGRRVMSKDLEETEFQAALIQGNVDPRLKWETGYRRENLDIYIEMTRKTVIEELNLIIWPETAIPVYLAYEDEYKLEIQQLVDSLHVPILTGAPHYKYDRGKDYLFYNSVFLFRPGMKRLQEYSKIHLVPFSERIPFQTVFPFLRSLNFGQANFSSGEDYTLFSTPSATFGVLICFESIFPDLMRQFVLRGADFVVVITNDAWFGRTSSPYQHARIAIFRSIENRIGLARCANTGVTMFIDPYGRAAGETKIFTKQASKGKINFRKEKTFYTQYGNIFSKFCVVMSILWLLFAFMFGGTLSNRTMINKL